MLIADSHAWWPIWPILWIAVIVAAVWFLSRRWRRPDDGGLDSARKILAERFARGELTHEEYRERLAQLG
ncbi:MAG TPA: SHOCT domain-containing protein [Gaiellaceae bacterium]|jgi:putative membrane protein